MKQLVNLFKLLSDESRLRVILLLAQDKLCVCEITGILDLPQPTVSKALSKLRDLDLVMDERSEKYIYYSLKNDDVVFKGIIDDILLNLDNYQALSTDKKRISLKETFKNQIQLIEMIGS